MWSWQRPSGGSMGSVLHNVRSRESCASGNQIVVQLNIVSLGQEDLASGDFGGS